MCVHLQDGLHELCRMAIAKDTGFLEISGADPHGAINDSLFGQYREYRLRETLRYAFDKSPFYRRLFNENGILPGDIASFDDLWKLPFTTPEDIRDKSYEFLCVSQGALERNVTFLSSGTTGIKKKVFFSPEDVQAILRFLAVGMRSVASINAGIYIMLPNSHGRGIGELLANSLRLCGMKPEVGDLEWPAQRHIGIIEKQRPEVIFGNARSIFRLTQQMRGNTELSSFGVKVLFLTMEHSSQSMVRQLEDVWKCRVIQHYGLAEMGWGMAVSCPLGDGYHYNEFGVIAQVVDPLTGADLEPGREGELVFTSLGREAMPLIRYRSHDIATLTSGECGCGRCMERIGFVRKRMESAIRSEQGVEILPSALDEVIYSHPDVIDYRVTYDERSKPTQLDFEIEMIKANDYEERAIASSLELHCETALKVRSGDLRFVSSGELFSSALDKKMIRVLK